MHYDFRLYVSNLQKFAMETNVNHSRAQGWASSAFEAVKIIPPLEDEYPSTAIVKFFQYFYFFFMATWLVKVKEHKDNS